MDIGFHDAAHVRHMCDDEDGIQQAGMVWGDDQSGFSTQPIQLREVERGYPGRLQKPQDASECSAAPAFA